MRRMASLISLALAFSILALARSSPEQSPGVWTGVERVVAVGDIHGDYDQLVAVLKSAGLIDDRTNWAGGKTHLVQTGDVLDRGPASRQCMDLLMKLEKQAAEAGGYMHALIGNHEAMNVYGDLRYVPAAEYANFRDEDSEKTREAALKKEHPRDRAQWEAAHPLGYFEQREAYSPKGIYGKWILTHDAVIKINDSLFVHGGISARYAPAKLKDINQRIREELKQVPPAPDSLVKDVDGPLWYRGLAQGDDSIEPVLQKALKNYGVERIVMGHTPNSDAVITSRFDGRVLLIDIGLSKVYDPAGRIACLVIEKGAKPYALHRGTRLELPSDEGKDLLRYLKAAAALDPPPSPLLRRIGELEAKTGSAGQ